MKMVGTDTTSVADDEEALRYLPPGWTEEKYANATDEDFENLPDDVSYCSWRLRLDIPQPVQMV